MVLGCVHGGDGSGLSIGRFKRVRLSKKTSWRGVSEFC